MLKKAKVEKNKFESWSVDAILEYLDEVSKDMNTEITQIQIQRNLYIEEFSKLDSNKEPSIKSIEKVIKEIKPHYLKYNELGMKLMDIKQELIRRTGLKENDLKGLYDLWRIQRVLDKCNSTIAI